MVILVQDIYPDTLFFATEAEEEEIYLLREYNISLSSRNKITIDLFNMFTAQDQTCVHA